LPGPPALLVPHPNLLLTVKVSRAIQDSRPDPTPSRFQQDISFKAPNNNDDLAIRWILAKSSSFKLLGFTAFSPTYGLNPLVAVARPPTSCRCRPWETVLTTIPPPALLNTLLSFSRNDGVYLLASTAINFSPLFKNK
jgi:hypothetical protein